MVELNTDDSTPAPAANYAHAPDAPDSFATAPPVRIHPVVHPVPPSQSAESEKDHHNDEGPANFNRVRIKAQIRRQAKDQIETPSSSEPQNAHDTFTEQLHDSTKHTTDQGSDYDTQSVKSLDQDSDAINSASRSTSSSVETSQKVDEESEHGQNLNPHQRENPQEKKEPATRSRRATEADAIRAGIPAGYSLKYWDPDEEPIILLGSVFDGNSLGKWIFDWTVYHYGPGSSRQDMVGELWLLLIKLAGNIRRAEDTIPKIKRRENYEMVEDFIESGERLWMRLAKLLKLCEGYMMKASKKGAAKKEPGSVSVAGSGGRFVEALLGPDQYLEQTEKWMTGVRLWDMRFHVNCEDILRNPFQDTVRP